MTIMDQQKPFVCSQSTLVVGLGATGLSAARYLTEKNCPVALADTREDSQFQEQLGREFPHAEIVLGEFNYEQFKVYPQIIVSPGVSVRSELFKTLQENGHLIIGDIELFAQVTDKPVIAITGSNGKSTVTTLVEKIANDCGIKTIAGGNLGIPALDLLKTGSELYILELSSFQLETTYSLKTLSAVVLNVSEDHMDRYQDMNDYRSVKQSIYAHTDWAVINKDEAELVQFAKKNLSAEQCLYFGSDKPADNEYGLQQTGSYYNLNKGEKILLNSKMIHIKGIYNYLNILSAIALLEPLSLDKQKMAQAINGYAGLLHRCEWVAEIDNVQYYNDSKGTNAGASIAAINGLETIADKPYEQRQLILIAGGTGKDADFSELGQVIKEKVKALILMGKDARLIYQSTVQAGMDNEWIYQVQAMQDAVLQARQLAVAGDQVLLSPACASFDMYENYIARGNDFKEIVTGLSSRQSQGELRDVS